MMLALQTRLAAVVLVHSALVTSLANSQSQFRRTFRIDGSDSMAGAGEKPAFCNGLDCPEYTEILKTKNYEERDYAPSRWVSTHLEGVDYDQAVRKMFMKLFNYIQGANSKNETIAMTAPVLNRVIPGAGPACKSNFTMYFYISPSEKEAPAPSDETVVLTSLPQQKVFIRYFGGFASQSDYVENAKILAEALVKDSKDFDSSYFFTAGYDSPFKILNRHNEVWYIAR